MSIRLFTLLCLIQGFFTLEAMDITLSDERNAGNIATFLDLLKEHKLEKLAKYLESSPMRADIVPFLRDALGSDKATLQAVRFFECSEATTQDAVTNSASFRNLFFQLQSKEKAVGVFIIPRIAPENRKSEVPPRGLTNLGNTCFLNAVVQAFQPAASDIADTFAGTVHNETRRLLTNLLTHMDRTHLEPFEKHAQKDVLNQESKAQQCNIEFMDKLFDAMQTDTVEEIAPELKDMMSEEFLKEDYDEADELQAFKELFFIEEQKALVHDGDSIEKSSFKKESYGPALHVAIQKGSLTDCLEKHFSLERFAQEERPRDEKKGTLFDAQQRRLSKIGERIIIHVKRARYDTTTKRGIKSHEPTPFALSHLDLKDYFIDSKDCPDHYELETVIMHSGASAQSGHYIAYSRRANANGTEGWYKLDDSSSTHISNEEMMRIALSGTDGNFLPTSFVYRLSQKLHRSGSPSEGEDESLSPNGYILCTVVSNKTAGIDIQDRVFSREADAEIDSETKRQKEVLTSILKKPPFTIAVPNTNHTSGQTKNISATPNKYIWSSPKNLLIPLALLLIAALFGKEKTPTEKALEEKEKEEKKKRDQKMREPKRTLAAPLDPSEEPSQS